MKLLVFANTDGNFEYINELLEKENVDAGISLGDMFLYSESTPIKYFLRSKFRHLSEKSIELNKKGFSFVKPVFGVYGELDDPFIPANELKINNLFLYWQLVNDFLGHNEDRTSTKKVRIGFLSGYYNPKKFQKSNSKRNKMSRERQSLALCGNDFNLFNNDTLDILFTHDSPSGCPPSEDDTKFFGCCAINNLINRTRPALTLFGHHRSFSYDVIGSVPYNPTIIGIPPLEKGYAILDIYKREVRVILQDSPISLRYRHETYAY